MQSKSWYQRGGQPHQNLRAHWVPIVSGGGVRCARGRDCIYAEQLPDGTITGGIIHRGELWDLDHRDDRRGYLGPSHMTCNRRAGAVKGNRGRRTGTRASGEADVEGTVTFGQATVPMTVRPTSSPLAASASPLSA
jgi:hypothetical protein